MSKGEKKGAKEERVKMTIHLGLECFLGLDRIKAKRLRAGASLSEVSKSALIEEAVEDLLKKEKV